MGDSFFFFRRPKVHLALNELQQNHTDENARMVSPINQQITTQSHVKSNKTRLQNTPVFTINVGKSKTPSH